MTIRTHILLLLLVLMSALPPSGCDDEGATRTPSTDGDAELDPEDLDMIVLAGGSSSDSGNAIEIYFSFDPLSTGAAVRWDSLQLSISHARLPRPPSCDAAEGIALYAEQGPFRIEMLDQPSTLLQLQAPVGEEFCSINFVTDEPTFGFLAEGRTDDDTAVRIVTNLNGNLSFVAADGQFVWQTDEQYRWVAGLNPDSLLSDELMAQIEPDAYGSLLIDREHNTGLLKAVTAEIESAFTLFNDLNGNGMADLEEQTPDNTVGYSSREGVVDGDADGDIDGDADPDPETTDGDPDGDTETPVDGDGEPEQETPFDPNDRDGDGVANDIDNCPDKANPTQLDEDDDQVGDVCDNCRTVKNNDQVNRDDDEWGDACDNCPETGNPDQSDVDQDERGDVCDLCPYVAEDQDDDDDDGLGDDCDPVPGLGDYCRMVECTNLADICEPYGLTCVEWDIIPIPIFGNCSKDCSGDDDCPAPWACIDHACVCPEGSRLLDCPLLECTQNADCEVGSCKLPEGYCTVDCESDTDCHGAYGQNWNCGFDIVIGRDVCQCELW